MGGYEALLADLRAEVTRNNFDLADRLGIAHKFERPDETRQRAAQRRQPPPRRADLEVALGQLSKSIAAMPRIIPIEPTPRQRLQQAARQAGETMAKAQAAFDGGAITGHELCKLELIADNAISCLADHVRQSETIW